MKTWTFIASVSVLSVVVGLISAPGTQAASRCNTGKNSSVCRASAQDRRQLQRPPHTHCDGYGGCPRSQKMARKPQYRSNDWYLHRPSTPEERAETMELNRESLALSEHQNREAAVRPTYNFQYTQEQYRLDLRNYRAALDAYDRQMRTFSRSLNPPRINIAPPRRDGRDVPTSADYYGRAFVPAPADGSRLDPWHGYNPGPGNGY